MESLQDVEEVVVVEGGVEPFGADAARVWRLLQQRHGDPPDNVRKVAHMLIGNLRAGRDTVAKPDP